MADDLIFINGKWVKGRIGNGVYSGQSAPPANEVKITVAKTKEEEPTPLPKPDINKLEPVIESYPSNVLMGLGLIALGVFNG